MPVNYELFGPLQALAHTFVFCFFSRLQVLINLALSTDSVRKLCVQIVKRKTLEYDFLRLHSFLFSCSFGNLAGFSNLTSQALKISNSSTKLERLA